MNGQVGAAAAGVAAARPITSKRASSISITTTGAARRFATAAIALVTTAVNAAVYHVSPDGNPMTLTAALEVAGAGDIISLGDGIYREPIVTMNAGEDGNPLVIEGERGAVINYFSGDREIMWSQKVVDIRHSWITLRGFTVDGHVDNNEVEESYVDKCIWVEGQGKPTMVPYQGSEVETSLIGTVIDSMKIQNCGMEGIRIRNWVTNMVIINNDIEDCGIWDFRFRFDGVVGEAIYIGTSSNQWTDGPDGCNYNLVTGNKLVPRGNECVDIKEGATMNVVEYNDCAEQLDEHSGCYDSRGNNNIFRYNKADECLGAGVRLGGHVINGFIYGVDNEVYGNDFSGTRDSSVKAMQHPQGIICGNSCDENSGECEVKEKGDDKEIDESWDKECEGGFTEVPFIDDTAGTTPKTPSSVDSGSTSMHDDTSVPTDGTSASTADTLASMDDDEMPEPEYEALGCYTDKNNSGRVMRYRLNDVGLTTESCALECEGYKFFGTQYSSECWCGGDETDHVQHGESELCDSECAGDATQICGGYWAMNVYQYSSSAILITSSTLSATTPATTRTTSTTTSTVTCNGVLSNLGYYCCSSTCGTCGGPSCSSRDGGASSCCTKQIYEAGATCEDTGGTAPCIVNILPKT